MERYTLTCRQCEETGEIGLTLDAMSTSNFADGDIFVMFGGIGLAHDVTEHVNGVAAIGTVHDEFQALGAIWYTRGQFDDLRRDNIGSGLSTHKHIASDITRMFDIATYEGLHGKETAQDEDEFEDDWSEIIETARADIIYERDSAGDLDELDMAWLDEYLDQALQGMRLGFAKQCARYPDAMAANSRFWRITDAIDSHGMPDEEYLGAPFVLAITDDGTVSFGESYEFDEDDTDDALELDHAA